MAKTKLPDDAEVVVSGRNDTFHTCSAEPSSVEPVDCYGQARFSVRLEDDGVRNALLIRDTFRG